MLFVFFVKQKTAYEMRISDWSSDVCSSDLDVMAICYTSGTTGVPKGAALTHRAVDAAMQGLILNFALRGGEERMLILAPLAFTGGVISNLAPWLVCGGRSEEHTSELQSLMRISYAVFCLKKKTPTT